MASESLSSNGSERTLDPDPIQVPKVTRLKKVFPPPEEVREPGRHQFDYLWREKSDIGGALGPNCLIFAGIVLLLNTLGLVPWSVWSQLFKFWPIFVVFAGIQLAIVLFHSSKLVTLVMGGVSFIIFLFVTITAIGATDSKLFQRWNVTLPGWWKEISLLIREAGK